MLEKREICRKRLEPEHVKEKLSDFGKNFIDDEVGNYIDTVGYLQLNTYRPSTYQAQTTDPPWVA